MPFTGSGADVSLARNTSSGKFTLQWDATGNPIFVDDQSHAVLSLIYEQRGKWWADPTGQRGSDLYTIKEMRTTAPSKAAAFVLVALQPLVDAGKIIGPTVTASRDAFVPSRLNVNPTYSTPLGQLVSPRASIGY